MDKEVPSPVPASRSETVRILDCISSNFSVSSLAASKEVITDTEQ